MTSQPRSLRQLLALPLTGVIAFLTLSGVIASSTGIGATTRNVVLVHTGTGCFLAVGYLLMSGSVLPYVIRYFRNGNISTTAAAGTWLFRIGFVLSRVAAFVPAPYTAWALWNKESHWPPKLYHRLLGIDVGLDLAATLIGTYLIPLVAKNAPAILGALGARERIRRRR